MKKLFVWIVLLPLSAWAQQKLSTLPPAQTQTGTEIIPEYQAGSCITTGGTCGVTPAQLANYAVAQIPVSAANAFTALLLANNVDITGTIESSSGLQAALNACTQSVHCVATFPPNAIIKINNGITITSGVQSIDSSGLNLNATGMTTGCISVLEASFTASITGTVMTVTAISQGTVRAGDVLSGSGITAGTTITAVPGTGAGLSGTYNLSQSQSVGSETMTISGCFAMVVSANASSPYWIGAPAQPIGQFSLSGPTANTSNVDGIFIGRTAGNGNVTGQSLSNFFTNGFRDAMVIGSDVYVDSVWNGNIQGAWRNGLFYNAALVSGENFSWHGGGISGCVNPVTVTFTGSPSGTSASLASTWILPTNFYPVKFSDGELRPVTLTNGATTATWAASLTGTPTAIATTSYGAAGVYLPNSQGNGGTKELFLAGVSLDYNDQQIVDLGGIVDCTPCHIEDNHYQGQLITIVQGTNSQPTGVQLDGGTVALFDLSPRSSLISVSAPQNGAFFRARARFANSAASTYFTVSSGTPAINVHGSNFNDFGAGGASASLGTQLNLLHNPGFETGTLAGWQATGNSTGPGWQVTVDTVTVHSGTYSMQVISTTTGTNTFSQSIPCQPGDQLKMREWINISAYTSGTLNASVYFYDSAGVDKVSSTVLRPSTGTTPGWLAVQGSIWVPSGTQSCWLGIDSTDFIGTFNLDDAEFNDI
jgi:hypothetical protein